MLPYPKHFLSANLFQWHLLSAIFLFLFISCKKTPPPLFEWLPPQQTGIEFINTLEERVGNNILESEFFYNGGGIAVGDINNNGLPDLYFTANQGENALYLNLGDFRFENITRQAGVSDSTGWSAGVAMVDINGNGLLDIYVCKAGNLDAEERRNKLFINNGVASDGGQVPTFTEMAAEFGLDDPGYCTQPVFFDYNRNGLLDLYIVNYSVRHLVGFDIRTIRDEHDPYAGDRLYRNNGDPPGDGQAPAFTDVSEEAGILQNPIGFGLSATVSDLTGNGWPDIYVANDFMERDYMYINQGDGTFRDEILSRTDVLSHFSMGSDIADINNNGLPDILVVDMLPPGYARRSVFKTPDYSIYEDLAAYGYHRKNMRNVLQINNGDGIFSEVGQLAGISMTDWSWAALMADFDNDGYNDIFVANGFPRFYTNLDYLNNILWKQFPDEELPDDPELKYDLAQQMEPVQMHNFAFQNRGKPSGFPEGQKLSFADATEAWGLKHYSVASAAAYVDLNNNGALDLIVSNINEPPFVYKNRARELNGNHYLKVRLKGGGANTPGTGSKVKLTTPDGSIFFREAIQTRGFQASVDPVLHFGLGTHRRADVEVIWPDQSRQTIRDVAVNQTITIYREDADSTSPLPEDDEKQEKLFMLVDTQSLGITFNHEGSFFRDRILSPLMPHTLSNLGPAMAVADVNRDGLDDLFIGGGQGQPATLWLQQADGMFVEAQVPVFEEHRDYEDVDALFFDANGNGHFDLYVVSGGNFDPMNGPAYQDRLYLNDGFGNFTWAPRALPEMHSSGGTVTVLDIDGNGSPDLFVGGRVLTGQYPAPPRSYLLKNNNGSYTDVTGQIAPELLRPGLVTDAVWTDIENDGQNELIITGEWMPIRVFRHNGDGETDNPVFTEITEEAGLQHTSGWWNVLRVADLNGNGFPDLIAGNRGRNAAFDASPEEPVILYLGDFNNNGLLDPVITYITEGKRYPLPGRDLFLRQLPNFREQFPDYASWSTATIDDILSGQQLQDAQPFYVHTFASTIFINQENGRFEARPLPAQTQIAPVYDVVIADFFGNGRPDILAAGNNFGTRSDMGPMAGQGVLLKAEEDLDFIPMFPHETGFYAPGDVRKLEWIPTRFGPLFFLGRYGESVGAYLYQAPE